MITPFIDQGAVLNFSSPIFEVANSRRRKLQLKYLSRFFLFF